MAPLVKICAGAKELNDEDLDVDILNLPENQKEELTYLWNSSKRREWLYEDLFRVKRRVDTTDNYDDSKSITVAMVDIKTGNVVTYNKAINENLVLGGEYVAYITLKDSSNRIVASNNINETDVAIYRLWTHYHRDYLPIVIKYNGGNINHNWNDGFYFDYAEEDSTSGQIIYKENVEAIPEESFLKNNNLVNYFMIAFSKQVEALTPDDRMKLRVFTGHGWAEREWILLYPGMKNVLEKYPLVYYGNECRPSITFNHCNTAPNTFLESFLGLQKKTRLHTLLSLDHALKSVVKSRKTKAERWVSLDNNQSKMSLEDYVVDNDKEVSLRRLCSRIISPEDKTSTFNFGVRNMTEYIKKKSTKNDNCTKKKDVLVLNLLPLLENSINPMLLCFQLSKKLKNRDDYAILGDEKTSGPILTMHAIGLECKDLTEETWIDVLESDDAGLPYSQPIIFDRQNLFIISSEPSILFTTNFDELHEYEDVPINLSKISSNDISNLDAVMVWWSVEFRSNVTRFKVSSCPMQFRTTEHNANSAKSSIHYSEKQTLIRPSAINNNRTDKNPGRYQILPNMGDFELILRFECEVTTAGEGLMDMGIIVKTLQYPIAHDIWSENLAKFDKTGRYNLSMIKLRFTRKPDELKEVIKAILLNKHRKLMLREILEEWTR